MIDCSSKIEIFYEVSGAVINSFNVISSSYYTDSNGHQNLVELEYDDFGPRSVNLVTNLMTGSFDINFEDRFVTTDIRRAIKIALKNYKRMAENRINVYVPEMYCKEYFDEYPELFI